MKILIMAAGAVGSYFGSLLLNHNEVGFVARGNHLEKIKQNGLKIISESTGNKTFEVNAFDKPPKNFKADLVIFSIKSYQNEASAPIIKHVLKPTTQILSIQNGIGSQEFLSNHFGVDHVLPGATYIDATIKSPGVIEEFGGNPKIVFGGNQKQIETVDSIFKPTKINFEISTDIQSDLWKKLIYISALSGISCLLRQEFKSILSEQESKKLVISVLEESLSVANALGTNISTDIVQNVIEEFEKKSSNLISSMYEDLKANKLTEYEVINGAVSKLGKQMEVKTPINDIITTILQLHNQNISKIKR
ncbi:MAG: ketopantoate reductase family protein [Dehalococcoidia bacterium]